MAERFKLASLLLNNIVEIFERLETFDTTLPNVISDSIQYCDTGSPPGCINGKRQIPLGTS